MPLYKFVGNRILTTFQNAVLGTKLSEFHSGYRLYRVATSKSLPYELNSNDFHFDTEIILQLVNAGARILSSPSPRTTEMRFHASTASRTPGTLPPLRCRTLRTGREFSTSAASTWPLRTTSRTTPPSWTMRRAIPSRSRLCPPRARVLDLGAGPGPLVQALLDKGCSLTLVDQAAVREAPAPVRVLVRDLNDEPLDVELEDIDVILLLDVVEHLKDPERFLAALRRHFDYRTRTVVLTTPNVAFFIQRLMLLFGQFNYGKAGILDRTHTRLFTFRSFEQLLKDAGLRIRRVRGVPAPFPKALGDNFLSRVAIAVNQALIRLSRTLFAYQIFVEAETTPDVAFVLSHTVGQKGLPARDGATNQPSTDGANRLTSGQR